MAMQLTSSAFEHKTSIPQIYTCQGEDISVPLAWDNVPEGTKSLALIVDDPDAPDPKAPKMTYVHWVLYNIDPSLKSLPQDVYAQPLPTGILEGTNDWERTGYGGPCPPIGEHRYFHKLYALDTMLADLNNPTKKELEAAMEGHILEKVELVGLYRKTDQ